MRAFIFLLVLASCGKTAGDASTSNDETPQKQAQDASASEFPIPFSPIDTSTWLAVDSTSSCSFQYRFNEENAPPMFVTGSRVVATVEETEIPYVGFGCTGTVANQTVTFIGGTLTTSGQNHSQWAWIDVGDASFYVDDLEAKQCDLSETAASFGVLGSEVSGTFSCTNALGTSEAVSVWNGKYDTIFSNGKVAFP